MSITQRAKQAGFTIVELLIVIVVIGILASITIVAYNGVQQRARDTQRKADLSTIQKLLELYHLDNGGYPACAASGVATVAAACPVSTIAAQLIPKYTSKLPQDPVNSSIYSYLYAVGFIYDPAGPCGLATANDNYMLGDKLESTTAGACTGFWSRTDINYVLGSRNT